MNVVIVNCFDTFGGRVNCVKKYFEEKDNKVTVIQSDYMHIKKTKQKDKLDGFIFINTKEYKKNLSIQRLYSHYKFSKDAIRKASELKPDILYVIIPPNSLIKFSAKFKKRNQHVKLICDIYDMWPESIPSKKAKQILKIPFKLWMNIRNKNIDKADYIITECNLYQDILKDVIKDNQKATIYFAKDKLSDNIEQLAKMSEDVMDICYLGSINNIIDINLIVELMINLSKHRKLKLNIIGDGESKEELLNKLKENNIDYEYYGKVYDDAEKQKIFNKCYFGLNIMKEEVCVGLTMKSLEYFRAGIPIINNIKKDTKELVNKYNMGFNIEKKSIQEAAREIANITIEKNLEMRKNTKKAFAENFTVNVFNSKMDGLLEKMNSK